MFIWTIRTILVFSKKRPGYGKALVTYKNSQIGKSHFLRLSGKWINSSGVSFQKLSYVYEAPAGAFISDKLTFLEISDMPILDIEPYWALFGPYWALFGPYWALFGSIGPYLALTVKQKRNTEGPDRGHRIERSSRKVHDNYQFTHVCIYHIRVQAWVWPLPCK